MAIKNKQDSRTIISSNQESYNNNEEQHLYDFVNSMLRGRIFVGDFQEKRYVACLKAYRDVITLGSDEKDLHVDLAVVKKRLTGVFKNEWIGITTPKTIGAPVGYCIWVELSEEVFGKHWYKIRSVSFRSNEILLKIKPLRAISSNTLFLGSNASSETSELEKSANGDFLVRLKSKFKNMLFVETSNFLSETITLNNMKETTKFIALLLGTAFVALIGGAKYLADYSLKLVHELSILIKTLTPFAIACVEVFGKIVGGFYLLLAMLWRDRRSPQIRYHNFVTAQRTPMLTYKQYSPATRRYGASPKIVELN